MSLPETWITTRIGDVCTLNPPLAKNERPALTTLVSFVPMSAIDENRAEIVAAEVRPYAEVMRGYTPFRPGDVLFAKITPSMENGKAAIAGVLEGGVGLGSTEFHVLRPSEELLPDYLLYFIRQETFRQRAAGAFVGSAGQQRVPEDFLRRVKLPLPTLHEQHRIVEVLQQADHVGIDRNQFGEKVQTILHSALDRIIFAGETHPLRTLSGLVETRYGTSVPAEPDETSGLPVLRIPNVVTGEVDTSDLKYVVLPPKDIERLLLKYGDVLVVRSNGNPDYVGRSAPVTGILTRTPHVYASYLIRLRADIDQLLPEYLSSYLNSPYGRAAMRNAIRTTAGQSNLSGESLSRVKIPLPPIEQQRFFARVWNSLQDLRVLVNDADELGRELVCAMRGDAFTGALTQQWRARYRVEVDKADAKRRAAPRKGADRMLAGVTEHAQVERKTVLDPPARAWLASQLSEFQHNVWLVMREWKGSVVPDDTDGFADFCSNPGTAWPIEHEEASPDRIKRTLEQLAGLGLIAKVLIPNANGKYMTAFRPLREGEDTRLADASRLETLLRQETE